MVNFLICHSGPNFYFHWELYSIWQHLKFKSGSCISRKSRASSSSEVSGACATSCFALAKTLLMPSSRVPQLHLFDGTEAGMAVPSKTTSPKANFEAWRHRVPYPATACRMKKQSCTHMQQYSRSRHRRSESYIIPLFARKSLSSNPEVRRSTPRLG